MTVSCHIELHWTGTFETKTLDTLLPSVGRQRCCVAESNGDRVADSADPACYLRRETENVSTDGQSR